MILENTPYIETERLILRKFDKNDLDDILLIYGDEEVNTFLPWFPIQTKEAAAVYLNESILPCYTRAAAYNYAIALKGDNRAIGYVCVSELGASTDIGYGLRKELWHNGIVTEACIAVCGKLKQAGYPYVTATHDINNANSGEVMKKLGMTYRYSYEELWQPKNFLVTFRMYQLDFDKEACTYTHYQELHSNYFIEAL